MSKVWIIIFVIQELVLVGTIIYLVIQVKMSSKKRYIVETVETVKKETEEELKIKEEKLRKEQEYNEEQKKKGDEFARKITHSIRMPMAIITGYGELLQRGRYGSPEGLEYLDKICSNIHLLNEALASYISKNDKLARDEDGVKVVDIIEVIEHVANNAQVLLNGIGISINVNYSKSNAFVTGDKIEYTSMMYNLIENSIKYMRHGNRIYITAEETQNDVLVIYRDNGIGMKNEDVERITKMNVRGEDAINRGIEGTGMGMHMIASTVKKYGGTFEIKSSINEGIAIYLRFVKDKPLTNL